MKRYELLLLLVGLSGSVIFGQTEPVSPWITVTGNGEVRTSPDQAVIRLGVTQESPTAKEAQQKANSVGQSILSSLSKLGIPSKDIQTSQLTLYPIYTGEGIEPMRRDRPRIAGYRASNVVSVTVNKTEQVGPVLDAGLKAGSNQVEGISFGLRDDTAARQQALTQAAAEAQMKAETIAKALGVQVKGVQEVTEGGVSVVPVAARADMMMARAEISNPVSPGEVTVNATLTVKYRIAQ
ncbi:MAG: SIMPL domain-containing protein [Acidobacteriota bacterium]